MDQFKFPMSLRVTYGAGDDEQIAFEARLEATSEEGRDQIAATIASFLLGGAQVATVSNERGEVLYHEDKRLVGGPNLFVTAGADEVN